MAEELTQTNDDQVEETLDEKEAASAAASSSATDDEESPTSGGADEPTMKQVQEELEDLRKAKEGLLTAVRSERSQRQELQGKQQQINELLSDVLARREQELEETPEQPAAPDNIPVQVNDDGDAFVEPGVFNKMIEKHGEASMQRIQALEDELSEERASAKRAADFNNLVASVVSEDSTYSSGYNKLQNVYGWLNQAIVDYQKANKIPGLMPPGKALDIIADTEIEAEFAKAYPGVNVEKTIRAYDSKRDLRNAIKDVMAENPAAPVKTDPQATKKLLAKASSLGEVQNQAQVKSGLTVDTLAGMKLEEFEKIAATHEDLEKLWDIIGKDAA